MSTRPKMFGFLSILLILLLLSGCAAPASSEPPQNPSSASPVSSAAPVSSVAPVSSALPQNPSSVESVKPEIEPASRITTPMTPLTTEVTQRPLTFCPIAYINEQQRVVISPNAMDENVRYPFRDDDRMLRSIANNMGESDKATALAAIPMQSANCYVLAVLMENGTVVTNSPEINALIQNWKNITAIALGRTGADGTSGEYIQLYGVAANGALHTAGIWYLTADPEFVYRDEPATATSGAYRTVSPAESGLFLLNSDGTVIDTRTGTGAGDDPGYATESLASWTNVVQAVQTRGAQLGLRVDGTLLSRSVNNVLIQDGASAHRKIHDNARDRTFIRLFPNAGYLAQTREGEIMNLFTGELLANDPQIVDVYTPHNNEGFDPDEPVYALRRDGTVQLLAGTGDDWITQQTGIWVP